MSVSSNLSRKDVLGYWTLHLGWSGKESTVIWVLFLLSSSQAPPPHPHSLYTLTPQHSHPPSTSPQSMDNNILISGSLYLLIYLKIGTPSGTTTPPPHPTSPSPSWLMHWISCICNNQIRNNWLFAKMFNLNPEAVTIPILFTHPYTTRSPSTYYYCPESGTLRVLQDTCMQD